MYDSLGGPRVSTSCNQQSGRGKERRRGEKTEPGFVFSVYAELHIKFMSRERTDISVDTCIAPQFVDISSTE